MSKIILIGGAPGVGKSTLAQNIASKRQINWISTDQILTIMQNACDGTVSPELFIDVRGSKSPEEYVELVARVAEAAWKGVLGFIENNYPWEGCVIEGTAIMPHLVAHDLNDREDVIPIFLAQSDEAIRAVIERRSKDPWINTKTDEQKRRKAEDTICMNNHIKSETVHYKYALHELNGFSDAYDELSRQIAAI